MPFQVAPAAKVVLSVAETVISQFAWWVESGPQAGENDDAVAVTPVT